MSSQRCADDAAFDAAALLDGRLAVRLDDGAWRPGADSAVAVWRDGALEALAYPSNVNAPAPPPAAGAARYVLDTREVSLPFGVAGVGIAVVQASPRVEACVGLNGSLTLRFAHAKGLWQLLDGGETAALRREDALRGMDRRIAKAVREALDACCGEQPWDAEAIGAALATGALRDAVAKQVFRAIYPFGLVAVPRGTRVFGVAYSPEGASG